jgi:hypothetical protein
MLCQEIEEFLDVEAAHSGDEVTPGKDEDESKSHVSNLIDDGSVEQGPKRPDTPSQASRNTVSRIMY